MALSTRQVATADPAATLTAEEERQLAEMQQDADQPEPQPEPIEQQTEPPAEPAPAEPEQTEVDGKVDLRALREERELRKRSDAKIAQLEADKRLLEERTNKMLERFNQPQQQAQPAPQQQSEPLPDPEKDPAGFMVAVARRQQQQLDAVTQWAMAQEQRNSQAANLGNIEQQAIAAEQAYRAETPDYDDAVRHLAAARDEELKAIGYDNAAERNLMLRNEALQLAQRALATGKNPGSMIYDLAQARGYRKAEPTASEGVTNPGQPAAQERLNTIARGQQQAISLGGTRGSAPPPMTAERLLRMSDAEFDKALLTPEGRAFLGS